MKCINKLSIIMGTVFSLSLSLSNAQAELADKVKQALQSNNPQVEQGLTDVSKNLTALFAYRDSAPADTLGGGVFGVSLSLDTALVDFDSEVLKQALNNNTESKYDVSSLPVPRLNAAIGLPVIPLDIAVSYLPDIDGFSYQAAQLKYGVIEGGMVMPAVSLSANYSQTTLEDAFDTTTWGVDLSISKGFGVGVKLVPFAGIGYIDGTTEINSNALPIATTLKTRYENTDTKLFAGASLQLGLFDLSGQWDQIGGYNAYSVKLGLRF